MSLLLVVHEGVLSCILEGCFFWCGWKYRYLAYHQHSLQLIFEYRIYIMCKLVLSKACSLQLLLINPLLGEPL
jgi:hypothetical protein